MARMLVWRLSYELEFGGPSTRTQTNEIKHNCSSFRRTFRRMMPYTGCIEEENIEEEEAEGAGCGRVEVSGFRALNLGNKTADK
jgi:hypothetical protein